MTAFADYLDLRLAVAEHVGRDDIAEQMTRFVKAAEAWFNKTLRITDQVKRVSLGFNAGAALLPVDFMEVRSVFDTTGLPLRGSTREISDARDAGVHAIDGPDTFSATASLWDIALWDLALWPNDDGSSAGHPYGTIYLYGVTGFRTMDYFAALPTLTAGPATSNWLLQRSPNAYLYAVALEAAKWLKSAELIAGTAALLAQEMADLRGANFRRVFGNAVVRLQGPCP
jgi:hypothetical protein